MFRELRHDGDVRHSVLLAHDGQYVCAAVIGSTMRLTIVYNEVCDYLYILVIIKGKDIQHHSCSSTRQLVHVSVASGASVAAHV